MSKVKLQAKSKMAALTKELEEARRVASDVVERVRNFDNAKKLHCRYHLFLHAEYLFLNDKVSAVILFFFSQSVSINPSTKYYSEPT